MKEIATLTTLSRSSIELASRVSRTQMLLAYRENSSFCVVGQRLGVHHQSVQRCVERALADGPLEALDDRPRPGKEPTITPEAKAWLVSLPATRPRTTAIHIRCGRRGCWRAMQHWQISILPGNVEQMMRGWIRFGVILSVIWALVGGFLGNHWAVNQASKETSAQVDECLSAYQARPRSNDGGTWTPCWEHFGENFRRNVSGHWWTSAQLSLLPIPIAWLVVYGFVRLYRWIRRGE